MGLLNSLKRMFGSVKSADMLPFFDFDTQTAIQIPRLPTRASQPRSFPRLAALGLSRLQSLSHLGQGGERDVHALEDRANMLLFEMQTGPVVPVIAYYFPGCLQVLDCLLHPASSGNDISRMHV